MTDTKELLQKIAALRMRLNTSAEPSASTGAVDPLAAIEDKLQRGAAHNTLIESSLHAAGSSEPAPTMHAPLRVTERGARLLAQARELLQGLRRIVGGGGDQ